MFCSLRSKLQLWKLRRDIINIYSWEKTLYQCGSNQHISYLFNGARQPQTNYFFKVTLWVGVWERKDSQLCCS